MTDHEEDDDTVDENGFNLASMRALLAIPAGSRIVPNDSQRDHLIQQIAAKTWDDLKVREYEGRLWFPIDGYRRNGVTGEFDKVPILASAPEGPELRASRIMSRELAREQKLDLVLDKDQVGDLENLCILWHVIRDPAHPNHKTALDPLDLEKRFARPSLELIFATINQLRRILDPHLAGMNAEELSTVTAAIVARQNLSPLFAFDSVTQDRFVITMASMYQLFLMARSSPGSSKPSTPEP